MENLEKSSLNTFDDMFDIIWDHTLSWSLGGLSEAIIWKG